MAAALRFRAGPWLVSPRRGVGVVESTPEARSWTDEWVLAS